MQKKVIKIILSVILIIGTAAAFIYFYADLKYSPSASRETRSINILTYKDIPLSILDGFHDEYPGYKINMERYSKFDFLSFLDSRLNESDSVDLIEIPAEAYSTYIYNDTLLPITDMDAFKRINPDALDYLRETSRSDKYFGIPYQSNYLGIWYNVSLFETYKLEPPDTLERFLSACRVFTQNGVAPLSAGLSDSASSNNLMTVLTAGAFPDALQICYDMRSKGYLTDSCLYMTGAQAFQAFLDSTYAMTIAPESYISMVDESVLQQININVCGFHPAGAGGASLVVGSPADSIIGVCKASSNIDICKTFLDYYTQYETVFQYIEDTRTMTNIQTHSVSSSLTSSWNTIKSRDCYIPSEHFYLSPYTKGKDLYSLGQELFYNLITPEEFMQRTAAAGR